ncbi:MAG: hypothetical protein Q4D04_15005, partial [Clostridia bacterium]|nr:hypothetical protein [Clostridia bacterium]
MDFNQLESETVVKLRALAKSAGIRLKTNMPKADIIRTINENVENGNVSRESILSFLNGTNKPAGSASARRGRLRNPPFGYGQTSLFSNEDMPGKNDAADSEDAINKSDDPSASAPPVNDNDAIPVPSKRPYRRRTTDASNAAEPFSAPAKRPYRRRINATPVETTFGSQDSAIDAPAFQTPVQTESSESKPPMTHTSETDAPTRSFEAPDAARIEKGDDSDSIARRPDEPSPSQDPKTDKVKDEANDAIKTP